jgi:hypothetical protein
MIHLILFWYKKSYKYLNHLFFRKSNLYLENWAGNLWTEHQYVVSAPGTLKFLQVYSCKINDLCTKVTTKTSSESLFHQMDEGMILPLPKETCGGLRCEAKSIFYF